LLHTNFKVVLSTRAEIPFNWHHKFPLTFMVRHSQFTMRDCFWLDPSGDAAHGLTVTFGSMPNLPFSLSPHSCPHSQHSHFVQESSHPDGRDDGAPSLPLSPSSSIHWHGARAKVEAGLEILAVLQMAKLSFDRQRKPTAAAATVTGTGGRPTRSDRPEPVHWIGGSENAGHDRGGFRRRRREQG
jgi:hypothetical protein